MIGCAPGDGNKAPGPEPPQAAPADATPAPPPDDAEPLDVAPAWRPPTEPTNRARTLEITLRSTPPGAIAAVDGKVIGATPTFWRGKTTGRDREFTFVLADHAMARYRFVPTTSGVVHATLKPLVRDDDDAGAR